MKKFNFLEDLGAIRNNFPDSKSELESKNIKNIKEEEEKPEDIYLLGGKDAEMRVIKKRLERAGQKYIDKELGWGAKIEDYSKEITEIINSKNIPIAIELANAEKIEGVVDIDHHNEKSNRPASLLQVMQRLNSGISLFDELIAANDSGFIPAMEKKIEEYREKFERNAGREVFEELKRKWISIVRKIDRQAQGITKEQEEQADMAIKNKENFYNNSLTIVRSPHSKCATITDRLYGKYENLFIPSEDGESNFYGNGKLCQELKDKFEGSWAGGSGLGDKYGEAYWGGYPDKDEVEKYIKQKVEFLSEDFSRFDNIFIPENYVNFTETGKKIYELGSFKRMNDAVEVSNIEIIDKGNDFIIDLNPKEGWKIYSIDIHTLAGGFQRYLDRKQELQKIFGFNDDREKTPLYIFLREEENISEKIMRGLKNLQSIKGEKPSWYLQEEYHKIIKKFPQVEKAIQSNLESADPRFLNYSLGKVDISVQKTWEIKDEVGYGFDPGDASLLNTCKDFEMLEIGGCSTYNKINELKDGNIEIFTPKTNLSAEQIKEQYEKWEKDLDQFKSSINRGIQEKRIKYYKRVYKFVKDKKNELEQLTNNPELLNQYFAKGSMEQPIKFNGFYEDLKILNTFLKDKIVAVSRAYYEGFEKVGKYSTLGSLYPGIEFSSYSFNNAIETIDSGISFSADTFAVDKIINSLKIAGYEVESWGRSGFKSRNGFNVLLPKNKINAHIIEYGNDINNRYSTQVWYCGEVPIEINDETKKIEVEKIIKEVCDIERNKLDQEFINEFKSRGDGIFAVMETGGYEKFQSIPDRFKVIARMRIANTQDHRRNISHAYAEAIIDLDAIKGKKSITIKVPENMKGLVIGKGGSNIKRVSEELNLFIKVI